MNDPAWHRIIWPVAALALSLALGAGWVRSSASIELERAGAAASANVPASATSVLAPSTTITADFTEALPTQPDVDALVATLQRSTAARGAVFVSIVAAAKPATARRLGRVEMSVVLRGNYVQIKSVIAAVVGDEAPNLVIQRLAIKRLAAPAELEAQLALTLLSRPTVVSTSAQRP